MKINQELIRFLVTGICAVCIDLGCYFLISNFLSKDFSKGISFVLGSLFAYFINKYWTFQKPEKKYTQMLKFGVLYAFSLGINVLVNKITLDITHIIFLSFFIATGVTTVLNFIGQKWFVFK